MSVSANTVKRHSPFPAQPVQRCARDPGEADNVP